MQYSMRHACFTAAKVPWNKGKVTGAKPPLLGIEVDDALTIAEQVDV